MPSKKKIAFVANTSWSIYKFRLYLIKYLIQNGFTIYVLAPRDTHTQYFENLPGLIYVELTQLKSKTLSPLQDLRLWQELKKHYRRIAPDLIFHFTIKANIWGSLAAAQTRTPSVSVITGLGYAFTEGGWLQSFAKILYRHALKKNQETWFLNDDDRQFFLREKLVRPSRTFILPGEGVDPQAFAQVPLPSEDVDSQAFAPAPLTFLLIGRIIEHKGIREFIQAARIIREKQLNIRLQLLGFFDTGSPVAISRQELDSWQSENLVTYLGDTDNVAPFIAKADCIVLPSYREGMPLSLLEGASMARTLIATDVAGCRQLIDPGINGFLCPLKNGPALAEKMIELFELPQQTRRKMGEAGRALILQHFTQQIIANIYLGKIALFLRAPEK